LKPTPVKQNGHQNTKAMEHGRNQVQQQGNIINQIQQQQRSSDDKCNTNKIQWET